MAPELAGRTRTQALSVEVDLVVNDAERFLQVRDLAPHGGLVLAQDLQPLSLVAVTLQYQLGVAADLRQRHS